MRLEGGGGGNVWRINWQQAMIEKRDRIYYGIEIINWQVY